MLNSHIEWVLEMDIHDGQDGAIAALVEEMVTATQANEPGALTYEYYMSEDKKRCTVLERYADNDAVMTHLANFGAHFAERFLAIFAPVRLTVYGPSNQEVRDALSGFGATFENQITGFSR